MATTKMVKGLLRQIAWSLGVRPRYGNYGVERKLHLGGYWKGGDPNTFCPEVWDWFIAEYDIRSVIDVGCGQGHSTKYFADQGLVAVGIEGGALAIQTSVAPHLTVQHDYVKGPYVPKKPVDLVWCCEFVEHVEERFVPNFLATFSAARYCLMTHALPGQVGFHHVNCRPSEYWIEQLGSIGFKHDAGVTARLRAMTQAKHVAQTLLFFEKGS